MASRMRMRNCSLSIRVRPTPTTAKGSGRTRPWNIDHRAGTSFRRVRSPEAPKITRTQDSSADVLAIGRPSLSEPPRRGPRDLHELLQALRGLPGEAEADDPAAARVKRLEVALGLGGLERREAVRDPRDGEVVLVLAGDLDEEAIVPAPLVELIGRVQVLRSETCLLYTSPSPRD